MFLEETDNDKRRQTIISIGGESLSEAIHLYGFVATIDFVARTAVKHNDWVLDELLTLIPGLFFASEFLKKSIKLEVDTEVLLKKIQSEPNWLKKQGVL